MLKLIKIMICMALMLGASPQFETKVVLAPPLDELPFDALIRLTREIGVPLPDALALWEVEASWRVNPPDGKVANEKGAFQVTKDAAKDVKCIWSRDFVYSAECGIRYYKKGLKKCTSRRKAGVFYNSGRCGSDKIGAYGVKFGLALARLEQIHEEKGL